MLDFICFLSAGYCLLIPIKWIRFTKNNHLSSSIRYANALTAVIIFIRITSFKIDWFLDLAKKMIIDRQSTGEVRQDYMQLMLNVLKNNQTETAHDSESDSDLSDNDVVTKKRKDAKHIS